MATARDRECWWCRKGEHKRCALPQTCACRSCYVADVEMPAQPGAGWARLSMQLVEQPQRWVRVGPFSNLTVAGQWAQRLLKRRSLVRSAKVEHRNGGSWRPAKVLRALAMGLLPLLMLASCATIPTRGFITQDVKTALQEIPREGGWERLQCWFGVRVEVTDAIPTAAIGACTIYLNPRVYAWPHDEIRAVLAHELGHMMHNDSSALRLVVPQITKERQADARATVMLSRISLEACLALPRVLEALNADPSHPSPAARVQETRALCEQQAKRGK